VIQWKDESGKGRHWENWNEGWGETPWWAHVTSPQAGTVATFEGSTVVVVVLQSTVVVVVSGSGVVVVSGSSVVVVAVVVHSGGDSSSWPIFTHAVYVHCPSSSPQNVGY